MAGSPEFLSNLGARLKSGAVQRVIGVCALVLVAGVFVGVKYFAHPAQHVAEANNPKISVTGPYHNVGSFLAELANLRRIVTVSNLHLASTTKQEDGTTTAEFVASAYSLNTTPIVPTAPAKGDNHGRKS